jgi:hypothetical protein
MSYSVGVSEISHGCDQPAGQIHFEAVHTGLGFIRFIGGVRMATACAPAVGAEGFGQIIVGAPHRAAILSISAADRGMMIGVCDHSRRRRVTSVRRYPA